MSKEITLLIIKHPNVFIMNHKGSLHKSYLALCFHSLFFDSASWKIYIYNALVTESHALQEIFPRSTCCYNAKGICTNSGFPFSLSNLFYSTLDLLANSTECEQLQHREKREFPLCQNEKLYVQNKWEYLQKSIFNREQLWIVGINFIFFSRKLT